MGTYGPNDEKVERAVQNLLIEVAPERRKEIEEFWNQYDIQLYMRGDIVEKDTFILEAGVYREIRFNHRVMRAFWLASFIAWEGYRSIHSWLTTEVGDFRRFNDMIAAFYRILLAEDSTLVPMPPGIPDPATMLRAKSTELQGNLPRLRLAGLFCTKCGISAISAKEHPHHYLVMDRQSRDVMKNCHVINLQRSSCWNESTILRP